MHNYQVTFVDIASKISSKDKALFNTNHRLLDRATSTSAITAQVAQKEGVRRRWV